MTSKGPVPPAGQAMPTAACSSKCFVRTGRTTAVSARTSSYCNMTESRMGAGSGGAGTGTGAGAGFDAGAGDAAAAGGAGVETRAGDEPCVALSPDTEGGSVVPGLAGSDGCNGADVAEGWRAGEEGASAGGAASFGGSLGAAAAAAFARACAIRSACFSSCFRHNTILASSC